MGCWNGTCMISNLPILSGDEVKLVFLHRPMKGTEDLLNKSAYCYVNGIFQPGAFALDGKYDDYGGVEEITEDINFELINVYFKTKFKKVKVEGEEVEDFTIYNILEGIERGSLEVFVEGDVQMKALAQKAVEAYSVSGYSTEKVKREWEDLANIDVSEKWRDSNVNFVMIRKDVWDYIVANHKTEFWKDKEDRVGDKDYYQTAQEWVAKKFDKFKKDKYDNPMSQVGYAGGNRMFMDAIYRQAVKKCDDEQLSYFQKLYTEATIMDSFLTGSRKGWMITTGAGSQSTGWECYLLLNNIVNDICNKGLHNEE
jgi:hypothetical protein